MKVQGFLPIVFLLFLGACASDRYISHAGHRAFEKREWKTAADSYAAAAQEPGVNQVLFLLDEGVARFEERQYPQAIELFLKAEKLAEIKDYTSISEEVGTLATSDNVRGYKGEDYEKILINVYLALAYAAQGDIEEAQVEARKINLILYKMIHEGKRNYEESPFARYLAAMLWEADRSWNDAYIDYKKTWELDPQFPDLGRDLLSMSRKLGFRDEEKKWKEVFPQAVPRWEPGQLESKTWGELVVIFEKGSSPVKVPRPEDVSLPKYHSRYSSVAGGRLKINGEEVRGFEKVLDIGATSERYLNDRIGRMKAAKLAGLAVKGAIGYGVGKLSKSQDLGWLSFFILMFSDHADVRSWRTLPDELQMVRVPLHPGTYQIKLESLGWSGEVVSSVDFSDVVIEGGRKRFLVSR